MSVTRLNYWVGWICWALAALSGQAAGSPQVPPGLAWLVEVGHYPRQPRSGAEVKVQAQVRTNVTALNLEYQVVEPGAYVELKEPAYKENWTTLPMREGGGLKGNRGFQAELPAQIQRNRRLIRYRLSAADASGKRLRAPDNNQSPNYAYFVYDGVPAWSGAIDPKSNASKGSSPVTFSTNVMSRVQAYHLIGKKRSIENATWKEQSGGKEYKYTGTLVAGEEVYDHIGFRARGGVWRYAMGKNMWKFQLPASKYLKAVDDFGRPYSVPWSKVNLRSCIQQGDYGRRGEQGMFESVGFALFNLAGVPAPNTHWIQLRIVDEAVETPANQYHGDFWGLYLAIENEDGRFLKTHGLPSGNLYKMEFGNGELEHHGPGTTTDGSDLSQFMSALRRSGMSDAWWRTNLDLSSYYSYRAICECIHHYDIGDGKNYDYYHNPVTGKWQVIPWDIDLTWANHMYGSGEDPWKRAILSRPAFRLEYQNRLREIRDLLFNQEETGRLIDQYAAVIMAPGGELSIAEADRRKWDYHPMMTSAMKAGQGLFYEAGRTKDFPGMVQLMKDYVRSRGAWVDSALLRDPQIPATPTVSLAGAANQASNQLAFRVSAYSGEAEFAAMKWRLAQIAPKPATVADRRAPGLYEIAPLWESELGRFQETTTLPSGIVKAGRTYRVRARMKDVTGRWSHWSSPVEFVAER